MGKRTLSLRDAVVLAASMNTTPGTKEGTQRGKRGVKKTIQKERYFPKTSVPAAPDTAPVHFKSVAGTYRWADIFLKRVSACFGHEWLCKQLATWKWDLSTCFSGVGCAESACISLVKAAEQFLRTHGKRKGKCHVNLVSHCEINKHCQKVLEGTYGFSGACLFEDVTNLDTEKGTGYCVRHKTMCKLSPTKSSDPNCFKVNISGPVCVDYSMMGRRAKEMGPSAVVHAAFYKHMRESDTSLLIVENVPEYEERIVRNSLVVSGMASKWELLSVRLDPRILGLGCARARVFIVAYRSDRLRWVAPWTLQDFVGCLSSKVHMTAKDYFWMDLPKAKLSASNAQNLAAYDATTRYEFPDLNQYASNDRGRGETVDKALMTLTTTSSRIFSKAHGRFLDGVELLCSHVLPCTSDQSKRSRAPRLDLTGIPSTACVQFVGNAMSVPTIGCVILACALALKSIPQG